MKLSVAVFLLLSTTACLSVLTGNNVTRQIDGSINDSDASTNLAGTYSSQGVSVGQADGLSEAKSTAPTHKKLKGFVRLQPTPNSQGPFTGTPSGASNQKVRSSFPLNARTRVKFELTPALQVSINSTGRVTANLAMWVLVGPQGAAVPGSVFTARYTFEEDPNNPAQIKFEITRSDGSMASGPMPDNFILMDTLLRPPTFQAGPGNFIMQYELNIQASGDTDFTFAQAEGKIDLVKVP